MKQKTSNLTGAALDWAVAKCEGFHIDDEAESGEFWMEHDDLRVGFSSQFNFSTNWAQGGPIIEREQIPLCPAIGGEWEGEYVCWRGEDDADTKTIRGPTPLIAAMRCYVASKLGDEIDIPDELNQQ